MSRRPSRTHTVTDAHTERTAKTLRNGWAEESVALSGDWSQAFRNSVRLGSDRVWWQGEWGLVSGIQELGKTGLRSGLVARWAGIGLRHSGTR